jgi:hypothetical protein
MIQLVAILASLFLLRPPSVLPGAGFGTDWSVTAWGAHGSWPRHLVIAALIVEAASRPCAPRGPEVCIPGRMIAEPREAADTK